MSNVPLSTGWARLRSKPKGPNGKRASRAIAYKHCRWRLLYWSESPEIEDGVFTTLYRGTSLTRKHHLLGPYGRLISMVLRQS